MTRLPALLAAALLSGCAVSDEVRNWSDGCDYARLAGPNSKNHPEHEVKR